MMVQFVLETCEQAKIESNLKEKFDHVLRGAKLWQFSNNSSNTPPKDLDIKQYIIKYNIE